MAGLEHLSVTHYDRSGQSLGTRGYPGERDGVTLPLRAIIADALSLDAAALVLAHNHPSGDATPSAADRRATEALDRVARPLGIRVHDHVIAAGSRRTSFRELGWL